MSEGEALYALLVVFYVVESVFWVRRGSLAFVRNLGRKHRPVPPDSGISNRQGGVVFSSLLPPLTPSFLARSPEVSVSPVGALSWVSSCPWGVARREQEGAWLSFDDLDSIETANQRIKVNGHPFLLAIDAREAGALFEELREIDRRPEADRETEISRRLDEALDADAARKRVEEVEKELSDLRLAQNLLFLHIFVAIPLLARYLPLSRIWLSCLLGLVALHGGTLYLFWRAHRKLHGAERGERRRRLLLMLLFPPAALRATDRVTLPALTSFHPLAAAAALCRPEAFREVAGRIRRDLEHPLVPGFPGDDRPAGAEAWYRERLRQAVDRRVRAEGIDPEELLRPPSRRDPGSQAFCPRCLAEYTRREGDCSDCGVGLERLTK